VWYIPPLSPVVDVLRETGHDGEDADNLFGAIDALRIPVEYLAELFTAGDPEPVTAVLRRLAAMRAYQRRINLGEPRDESIAARVGMTGRQMEDMYRLLAIAKYEERYVIPAAHAETAAGLEESATGCSLDYEGGPGMGGPFGEASGKVSPIAVESFHALAARQRADQPAETAGGSRPRRVNLLNWDGKGRPEGLFPPRQGGSGGTGEPGSGETRSGEAGSGGAGGPACPPSSGRWPPEPRRSCCGTRTPTCSRCSRRCGTRSQSSRRARPGRSPPWPSTWRPGQLKSWQHPMWKPLTSAAAAAST